MQEEAAKQPKAEPKTEEVKEPAPKKAPEVAKTPAKVEPKPIPQPAQPAARTDVQVDKTISTYNGAKTNRYNWSQSTKNVDVQIPIPKGTKPRDLLVVIKAKHLKVQVKG